MAPGSLWRRESGTEADRAILSAWPVGRPRRWVEMVNAPQTQSEVEAVQAALLRGRPFGGERWVKSAANRLSLEGTLRHAADRENVRKARKKVPDTFLTSAVSGLVAGPVVLSNLRILPRRQPARTTEGSMRTAIVIPARYASSRLPGKPLLKSTGKYLVQHVYERACQARRADTVIVATDDSRIVAAVESFGGQCAMTRRDHPSGTDRVAEVAAKLDADVVVNLQGDEPQIDPATIDLLPDLLQQDQEAVMATLAAPITSEEIYRDPNCVKVVRDSRGRAPLLQP